VDKISEAEAAQAKAQIDANYSAQRLQNASTFFGNLATLSQSSNKTLAAIGKAAAITQATIDGVLAVQKALASAPPPLSYVLAAAAGVAAAVNVAKIAGLKDGGTVDGQGGPRDDNQLRWLSPGEEVINATAAARARPLLQAINAGVDVRGLLGPRSFPPRQIDGAPSITNGGHVVHQTYAPNITNNDVKLETLLAKDSKAMRRWMTNELRNGELGARRR
jgi:hypothetical protein